MKTNVHPKTLPPIMVFTFVVVAFARIIGEQARAGSDKSIQGIVKSRCLECHDKESRSGGVDLETAIESLDKLTGTTDGWSSKLAETWIPAEKAIAAGKMPPESATPLSPIERKEFDRWFYARFVMPDGVQRPGTTTLRRLTREELQNTLEDILHLDIRQTVTNSRLHVIPDTILEKFFAAGVVGPSGFSNDAETLAKESIDLQTYARCFSSVLALLDGNPAAREKLFLMSEVPSSLTREQASAIIKRFGESAFRRKLTLDELDSFVAVYTRLSRTRTSYQAIKSAFLAVLLSPPFLFRFEDSPNSGISPVSDNELAIRLSYFLWSAPPDRELRQIAAAGKLNNDDELRKQVRRMLADPRRVAFAENMGGEWFDYKKLRQQSAVNKRSDRMAGFYRTQFEEALLFFDSIIRFNQPIHRLIDADWAFINRHQSGIYRLQTSKKVFDNVAAEEILPAVNIHYRTKDRQIAQGNYEYKHAPLGLVRLDDSDRGGFITLGSTLSVTSTENRTSPIRRGVWVMERILGEHFRVPDDVPDLESTQKKAKQNNLNLSHAEILKLHSSQEGCAACHKYIDPIGFGLELYDQLGIARANSVLKPGGEKLQWSPKITPRPYADRSWELKKTLQTGVEYKVYFQYTKGRHRLNVRKVRLEAGDVKLQDDHFGFTGEARRDNVWFFQIPKDAPTTGWKLTANVEGDGGTDSAGVITISGPSDKGEQFQLPNGNSFRTPAELKHRLLSDYGDQITDNIVKRVLAYALGRKIAPIDRPAIAEIKKRLAENEYRMRALIEAVVLSYPFRHKESRETP